jgi:hypothetical protein
MRSMSFGQVLTAKHALQKSFRTWTNYTHETEKELLRQEQEESIGSLMDQTEHRLVEIEDQLALKLAEMQEQRGQYEVEKKMLEEQSRNNLSAAHLSAETSRAVLFICLNIRNFTKRILATAMKKWMKVIRQHEVLLPRSPLSDGRHLGHIWNGVLGIRTVHFQNPVAVAAAHRMVIIEKGLNMQALIMNRKGKCAMGTSS